MRFRSVRDVKPSVPTLEGAGVRLKRAFGSAEAPCYDPFLLLDDIHSDSPQDYVAGFPWHPHRGIETVTYVLRGEVEHGDSLGNRGTIGSGDLQWMTAGSGIIHQEMPVARSGPWRGLQLWVNLPAAQKMMPPRYRDVAAADVPVLAAGGGTRVHVIAGTFGGIEGPVKDVVRRPTYLDVELDPGARFEARVDPGHKACAYVLEGNGIFGPELREVAADHVVGFGDGDGLMLRAGDAGLRLLLFSGDPLREPVAWRGPIVMNREEELELAFAEYRAGTFLKTAT